MCLISLDSCSIFSFKKALFFVSKIGIIKIALPRSKTSIVFYITKSHVKISTSDIHEFKIVENMLVGVNKILGKSSLVFSNKIMLFGIGFRSWTYKVKDGFKYLILKIGFSRDLSIKIPFVVKVIILKPTLLLFKSLDKNKLNQFVALLRSLKIPDSYKGKGLRYIEEKIVLKLGKT
jgi:large subunit ribosomal protein L6